MKAAESGCCAPNIWSDSGTTERPWWEGGKHRKPPHRNGITWKRVAPAGLDEAPGGAEEQVWRGARLESGGGMEAAARPKEE